jgi:hypothetical protein
MSAWSDCVNGSKTRTITTPASGNGTPCGTTSETCTLPARTYSKFDNTDKYGTDLAGGVGGTLLSCKQSCDTTANCTGFVTNKTKSECYLKTKPGDSQVPVYNTNYEYYYVDGTAPTKGAATAPAETATTATVTTATGVVPNAVPARTYSKFDNTDYGGNDIYIQENDTIYNCKSLCNNKTNCTGFTHYNNICYLKTKPSDSQEPATIQGATYYYVDGQAPAKGAAPRLYGKFDNIDYNVGNIQGGVKGSLFSCKKSCDATANCAGFVTNKTNTECYLKTKPSDTTFPLTSNNYDYYYVDGQAPATASRTYIQKANFVNEDSSGSSAIKTIQGTDLSTCKAVCNKIPECIGFSINKGAYQLCELIKEVGTLYEDSGYDYYHI